MWVLEYKESWVPKNWCFWTVVLEKALESPLDCKEIQPVPTKGDQSWVFIERTDVAPNHIHTTLRWGRAPGKPSLAGACMSIELVMPSNHLILCQPLLLLSSVLLRIRSSLMSQLFASGGQSIGASASAPVLPMNIQDWFPLGWTGWIFLLSKGLSS